MEHDRKHFGNSSGYGQKGNTKYVRQIDISHHDIALTYSGKQMSHSPFDIFSFERV